MQHGDYREALEHIRSGKPEPYFGMKYALQTLDSLLHDRPHLVMSLDAPVYDSSRLLNSIGQFDPLIPVKVDLSGKQWLSVQQIMKVPSLAI